MRHLSRCRFSFDHITILIAKESQRSYDKCTLLGVMVMRISKIILFSFLFIACASVGGVFFLMTHNWIDVSALEQYDPGRPTIVLDAQGNEWTRFALDRREPIALSSLPDHVIQAFLSAEDWQFFSHSGISYKGIARSLLVNLYHGRKVQGASTITQQLVKLIFFDIQKTFTRKIKEQLYALVIEQQFTKHQILEIYLNHLYFGCGIYGIEAAAQRFWKKSAADISIDEAAALAGIIKSPATYCPLLHPALCQQRRNVVLSCMATRGIISKQEYADLAATPLTIVKEQEMVVGLHFKELVRQFAEQKVGKTMLYTGGLTIQTTINQNIQITAQREFEQQIFHLRKELKKPVDGGLISFEVATGQIRAIVGGYDFASSSFNRATQARRQMGSIFKPLVFAAAVKQGYGFEDVVVDEPLQMELHGTIWAPNNNDCEFHGPITRAYALSHSNNIVAIKTILQAGIGNVIDLAKRAHLPGPFYPYPSLALGCTDATLKQASAMINIFANDGMYVEPYCISWIKDRRGQKIYKYEPIKERVVDSITTGKVAKVMMLGLNRFKKWFADRWFTGQAISKTGTTNDSRNCWYIGSTPTLTTGVYVGCDDNSPLGANIYPVRTAFPIWLGLTRSVATNQSFTFNPALTTKIIDEKTGEPSVKDSPDAIEIF